jgi:hypothetical protein
MFEMKNGQATFIAGQSLHLAHGKQQIVQSIYTCSESSRAYLG